MSRQKVVAVVFVASVFYQVITDRLVALAAKYARTMLYEATHILLVRTTRWSWLRA